MPPKIQAQVSPQYVLFPEDANLWTEVQRGMTYFIYVFSSRHPPTCVARRRGSSSNYIRHYEERKRRGNLLVMTLRNIYNLCY